MKAQAALTEEDQKPPGTPRRTDSPPAPAPASMQVRTFHGALVIAALALLLWMDSLWKGGFVLAAVGAVLVGAALSEYGHIARKLGAPVSMPVLVAGGVALFLSQWICWTFGGDPWTTALVMLWVVALGTLAGRAVEGRVNGSAEAAGLTVLGLIYVAFSFGFVPAIRTGWGLRGVVTVLAVCKITDIGAFYAGTLIAGARLAPAVSPRKTVAGAVGGVAAATVVAVAMSAAGWSGLRLPIGLLYGVVIGAVCILGDLAESVLKRQAGLKDSGSFLPGHSGVLDMVDDVLFALPVSYLFFSFAGQAAIGV